MKQFHELVSPKNKRCTLSVGQNPQIYTQRFAIQGMYKKYYKNRSTVYFAKKISICKILII